MNNYWCDWQLTCPPTRAKNELKSPVALSIGNPMGYNVATLMVKTPKSTNLIA